MERSKVVFNNEKLHYSCELMRALAHPLRLQILGFIDKNDGINVNQIYQALKIEQSVTSQHLKIMKMAGIVSAEKDGKFVTYNIDYNIIERANAAVKKFLKK